MYKNIIEVWLKRAKVLPVKFFLFYLKKFYGASNQLIMMSIYGAIRKRSAYLSEDGKFLLAAPDIEIDYNYIKKAKAIMLFAVLSNRPGCTYASSSYPWEIAFISEKDYCPICVIPKDSEYTFNKLISDKKEAAEMRELTKRYAIVENNISKNEIEEKFEYIGFKAFYRITDEFSVVLVHEREGDIWADAI